MNNILPTKNSFLLMLAFLLLGMPRPVVDATKDHDFDVVQAIVWDEHQNAGPRIRGPAWLLRSDRVGRPRLGQSTPIRCSRTNWSRSW